MDKVASPMTSRPVAIEALDHLKIMSSWLVLPLNYVPAHDYLTTRLYLRKRQVNPTAGLKSPKWLAAMREVVCLTFVVLIRSRISNMSLWLMALVVYRILVVPLVSAFRPYRLG